MPIITRELVALLVQETSRQIGGYIREKARRQVSRPKQSDFIELQGKTSELQGKTQDLDQTPDSAKSFSDQTEADYRFECCSKHISTSKGIVKEAIDRAIKNGLDSGVKQKIREAMEALNAMEPDVAIMLNISEVRKAAETLADGQRSIRKAVWQSGLEKGKGSIDDIYDLHDWLGRMLSFTYDMSEKYGGESCQEVI